MHLQFFYFISPYSSFFVSLLFCLWKWDSIFNCTFRIFHFISWYSSSILYYFNFQFYFHYQLQLNCIFSSIVVCLFVSFMSRLSLCLYSEKKRVREGGRSMCWSNGDESEREGSSERERGSGSGRELVREKERETVGERGSVLNERGRKRKSE